MTTDHSLLIDTLDPKLMMIQADISSRKRLLEEMASLLASTIEHEECRDKSIYHLLLEREKLGNTGIGDGVAVPHSRCSYISEPIIAVITLQSAVDYDSIDRKDVDIAFGLLVPEEATQTHLNLLAGIARVMSNSTCRKQVAKAGSTEKLLDSIRQAIG